MRPLSSSCLATFYITKRWHEEEDGWLPCCPSWDELPPKRTLPHHILPHQPWGLMTWCIIMFCPLKTFLALLPITNNALLSVDTHAWQTNFHLPDQLNSMGGFAARLWLSHSDNCAGFDQPSEVQHRSVGNHLKESESDYASESNDCRVKCLGSKNNRQSPWRKW